MTDKYIQFWEDVEHARENIYFAQKDRELIAKLHQQKHEEKERQILELCRMRCPKCGRKLKETDYQGVQIDRCLGCDGVWLDPGELETLAPDDHQGWFSGLLNALSRRKKKA